MIDPIPPIKQNQFFETLQSTASQNIRVQDRLVVQEKSSSPFCTVQNLLRSLRDKLFGGFLTIDTYLEQQKLQEILPVISQLEKASSNKLKAKEIVDTLPIEARRFVEIGIRKLLLSNTHRFAKKFAHAHAFLEERPQSKEVLDLLRKFAESRREIVALAQMIPFLQNRDTSPSSLIEHFSKLPESLRQKILLTTAKIDNPSKASIEQGRQLIFGIKQKPENLLRTAVATAVRGLKLHEDDGDWYQNAWRCRYWYA